MYVHMYVCASLYVYVCICECMAMYACIYDVSTSTMPKFALLMGVCKASYCISYV